MTVQMTVLYILLAIIVVAMLISSIIAVAWRRKNFRAKCPSCGHVWKLKAITIMYVGVFIWGCQRCIRCPNCDIDVGISYVKVGATEKEDEAKDLYTEEELEYLENFYDFSEIKKENDKSKDLENTEPKE